MSEALAAGEATMPNRTIYVADADMPIFEKAQQLAGDNLSATIVQALRRFVETEEAKASGYQEITVAVGKGRPYVQKKFRGRSLAKRRMNMGDKARALILEVYQTAQGRFAVYARDMPNWDWSGRSKHQHRSGRSKGGDWGWDWDWDWSGNAGSGWSAAYEAEERRLDVFENLETLKEGIPEEMYESIARYLQHGDDVEFLDI
jgi:EXLDI family protein